jgi:hypothetical protein
MDVDQAGFGTQGCDCRSASAEDRTRQSGGIRAGADRPGGDGDARHSEDSVSDPASLGWMIECASYPDASWMSALMSGR